MKLGTKGIKPAKYPAHVKRVRIWHKRLREPLLTLLLAVQVFILFGVPSLRSAGVQISHIAIDAILLTFIGMAILLSRSKVAIITMIVSVALTVTGIVWDHESPDLATAVISTTGEVLTQLSLLWVVSTAVFGPGRTTYHRILGAVVMYLGIGVIFTSLDILLARTVAGAFTNLSTDHLALRENLTYYSFSALTTGSFGPIVPMHPVARCLTNLESICGQLFPATLLARIVGLHSQKKVDDNGL